MDKYYKLLKEHGRQFRKNTLKKVTIEEVCRSIAANMFPHLEIKLSSRKCPIYNYVAKNKNIHMNNPIQVMK